MAVELQLKAQVRAACEMYRLQVDVVEGRVQGQVRDVVGAWLEPLELGMELSQYHQSL